MPYSYESNVVFIRDMQLKCVIGINAKERSRKTCITLNLTVWLNDMKSKDTDDLRDTVNYSEIYKKIRELETTASYQLLETLADHIMKICFEQPLAKRVFVSLEKPSIHKGAKSAGVNVIATREERAQQ